MKPQLPPCPLCGTAKQVHAVGVSGDMFRCGRCGGLFEVDPDEGGDYSSDPSRRMEMAERRQSRGGPRR